MEAPGGLEPPIEILQTSALPLGDGALLGCHDGKMEREKGFEPSTSTLARLHSTTELLPRTLILLRKPLWISLRMAAKASVLFKI